MPFTYTPIETGAIRLLVPDPVGKYGGHSWTLRIASLNDPDLCFEALSYVWGPQTERLPITLNGRLSHVHHNLHSALPYLARRGGHVLQLPIWIDALSINQEDEEEKMIQIRSMNIVYRQAERVWVWLGLAEHHHLVPEAISTLCRIAQASERLEKEKGDGEQKAQNRISFALDDLTPALWSVIMHIIGNEWSGRLWIVQEFALVEEVTFLCGEHEIGLWEFNAGVEHIFHMDEVRDCEGNYVHKSGLFNSQRTSSIRKVMQSPPTSTQRTSAEEVSRLLLVSLWTSGSHDCSQAQDRVLGLMGLIDIHHLEGTAFDFRLGYASISELYTRFSAAILLHAENTHNHVFVPWWHWLSLAFRPEKNPDLPTWVPDFDHQCNQYIGKLFRFIMGFGQWQASTMNNNHVRTGDTITQLVFQGKIVDEIDLVCEEIPTNSSPGRSLEDSILKSIGVLEWEHKIAKVLLDLSHHVEDVTSYHSAQVRTYWQTLMVGHLNRDGGNLTLDDYREFCTMSRQVQLIASKYDVIDR
jgi:hypothetical protein